MQAAKELITQYLAQQPHIAQASGTSAEIVKRIQSILGWPAAKEQIHAAMQYVPDELIEGPGTHARGKRPHRHGAHEEAD